MGRRVGEPQPSAGQDYLASVSDLMSGLVFIFIITLAVFALRLVEAQAKTEQIRRELTDSETVRKEIIEEIGLRLQEANVNVVIQPEHGVIRLSDQTVGFEIGRAEPRPEHRQNVWTIATVLARVLRCYVVDAGATGMTEICPRDIGGARVDTVMIEGHTDSNPIRTFKYQDNLELSSARSAEVLRMIEQDAPELTTLRNDSNKPVLSVSGYGETRPLDPEDPKAAFNRRIDIRFLMELPKQERASEPPPGRELRQAISP